VSPGAIEQTGKVATDVVDSLRNQPVTLALVAFNAIFLLVVYLSAHEGRRRRARAFW
jgi:hypothetical protein